MHVRTHVHGSKRVGFYACDSYHRRGSSVCGNRLEVPMQQTDAIVLDEIARQVLSVDVLEEIVARAMAAAQQTNPEQRLAEVSKHLRSVETQIHRFVDAIGRGGDVPELASALKKAQARRTELTHTIAALERQQEHMKASGLRADVEQRVNEWRTLMLRQVPLARQILRKMKVGIQYEPVEQDGQAGYRFRGTASINSLLVGLPLLVTSPSGFGAAGADRRAAPQTGRPMGIVKFRESESGVPIRYRHGVDRQFRGIFAKENSSSCVNR